MCIAPIPYPLEGPLGTCEDGHHHIAVYDAGLGLGLVRFTKDSEMLNIPARSVCCANCGCFWQQPAGREAALLFHQPLSG